jgi:hypothetical protein
MDYAVAYYYGQPLIEDRVSKFLFRKEMVVTFTEIITAGSLNGARKRALERAREGLVDTGEIGFPYHQFRYVKVSKKA